MLVATYDGKHGIIRTISTGIASAEEQAAYVKTRAAIAERIRQTKGRVLHLVDGEKGVVQSKFALDRLSAIQPSRRICRDRTAIVTRSARPTPAGSPTGKGQVRFFADEREALAWLTGPNDIEPGRCGLRCCTGD